MKFRFQRPQAGFTLIEAIIAIVITGIVAGIVAVFIQGPVQGYVDSVRRAELTDTADVALRRMTLDIRQALPNSLRIRDTTTFGSCAAGICYIEFIMTSGGGRYRDIGDGSSGGNVLGFAPGAGSDFDVLGQMPTLNTVASAGVDADFIVVYNLGPSYEPANAYDCSATPPGCNMAQVSSLPAANTVRLSSNVFSAQTPPLPSPGSRFQVVPGAVRAVTYSCPIASGNLTRFWKYGFNPIQPTAFAGGSSALVASGASCAVEYTSGATGRNGLLSIQLTVTSSGESVTLYQQVHVDNSP